MTVYFNQSARRGSPGRAARDGPGPAPRGGPGRDAPDSLNLRRSERFRNGDPSNDPGDKGFERLEPWKSNWWKTLDKEAPGQENFYKGEGNVCS